MSTDGTSTAAGLMTRLNALLFPGAGSLALRAPVPLVGVGITPQRITVSRIRRKRGGIHLAGFGVEELDRGTVSAALLRCSLDRPAALVDAVRRAVERAGAKPGRAALSLPDIAGRVTLMDLPEIPRSHQQAVDLIRFRLKRALPVRPEEMAVSFTRMSQSSPPRANGGGYPVLTVMAVRSQLEPYEKALADAGLRVGVLSLTTLDIANLFRPELEEIALKGPMGLDAALLNCEPDYCTLMIIRRGEPIFFRCKLHMEGDAEDAAVRMRNMRREISTSLSYFVEKLGGQVPLPVLVRGADPKIGMLDTMLADLGLTPARPADVSPKVTLPEEAEAPELGHFAASLGVTAGRLR